MDENKIIIRNRLSSNLLLSIGGIISILVGIYHLSYPYEIKEGSIPNWIIGIFFLPFGLVAIFTLLDTLYVVVSDDRIEIKSLFRKRIIHKKEIKGYGIKEYEAKYVKGERIRIFYGRKSCKFHTTHLESIDAIKAFLKGKKVLENAFVRERVGNVLAIILLFVMIFMPLFFDGYSKNKKEISENEEVEIIGIPAKLNENLTIIKEEGNQIFFELDECINCLFTVNEKDIPKNMDDLNLVVVINDDRYVSKLSGKEKIRLDTSATIPVLEVMVLE